MRKHRLALPAALSALTALMLVPAAQAAVTCTPTGYVKDGHPLTAAYVDTSLPAGTDADGTGCDIVAYYSGAAGYTVDTSAVHGARYYGVLANGATVDVSGSHVSDIGDDPSFTGGQHGLGIAYVNGASGTVAGSTVDSYQKGGIAADGDGTAVDVLDSTITGLGPVAFIAQNGVQFSRGATGSIVGNDISGNDYTGCSNRDAAKTGCIPYVVGGILLYEIDPSQVKTSRNHFRDNQRNLLMYSPTHA